MATTPKSNKRLLYTDTLPSPIGGGKRTIETYEGSDVIDVFADAVNRTYLGPIVSKMEFSRTVLLQQDAANATEERELFLRLTIPTTVLFEAIGIIMDSVAPNKDALNQAATAATNAIREAIKKAKDAKF